MPTNTERGDKTRQKILVVTRALIDRNEKAPTLQEVATKARVAYRTIYWHFPNVNTLIRHALALDPPRELITVIEPYKEPRKKIKK